MTTPISIMNPKMNGLMVISGLQGVGKSTAAFTLEHPDLTFILDFDCKGARMAEEYGIKEYHAPSFMKPDMDPREYDAASIADWAIEKLKGIKNSTYVVIDNATALEAGLEYVIEKDPAKYGLNPTNVSRGVYGGANPGISLLWNNIVNWLQNRGVRVITMVNHMSPPWANGAPIPNRFHIRGNKIFRNLSTGTFILIPADRGGQPPIPGALVVKEALANRKFDTKTGKYVTTRTLPFRIPIFTWDLVYEYFSKPVDFTKLSAGETWSNTEISTYGEFLSQEQLAWIKEAAKIGFSEDGPQKVISPLEAGKNKLFIELKELYPTRELLGAALKERGLVYSVEKHEVIRTTLEKVKNK